VVFCFVVPAKAGTSDTVVPSECCAAVIWLTEIPLPVADEGMR